MSGPKPPPISTGSYVAWDGGKGRVDLIVTAGDVPGVNDAPTGTMKSPVARVVVWEDGAATRRKVAAPVSTLRRIPPIHGRKTAVAPPAALVALLNGCEAKDTRSAGLTVYERGVSAWPGPSRTVLTAAEWALGRVERFVKVAAGEMPSEATNDADLLPPADPSHQAVLIDDLPDAPADDDPADDDPGTVIDDADLLWEDTSATTVAAARP